MFEGSACADSGSGMMNDPLVGRVSAFLAVGNGVENMVVCGQSHLGIPQWLPFLSASCSSTAERERRCSPSLSYFPTLSRFTSSLP